MKIFKLAIAAIFSFTLMTSCVVNPNKISIAYPNWAEGIAVTHLAREILVEEGYQVELLNADIAPIFTSLARGKTDVFLDSWLPVTHEPYFDKYADKLEVLGQVFDSARIGLVVPAYVPVNSIEDLRQHTEHFKGEIVGIDAGTGIMKCTESAIPAYELDYELLISSGPAMTTLLDKAIKKNDWIVVTGWTPHWMFDRYDLKVLADPKNIYGASESIHVIARQGFSREHPFAAELLGNIHLTDAQISSLMGVIEQERGTEREAVRKWIKQNRALVNSWIPKNKEAKMYKYDYRRLRV